MKPIIDPAQWIFKDTEQSTFKSWFLKIRKLADLVQYRGRLPEARFMEFYENVIHALEGAESIPIFHFLQKYLPRLLAHDLNQHTILIGISDLRTLLLETIIEHPNLNKESRNYWISQVLELFDNIQGHIQKLCADYKAEQSRTTSKGRRLTLHGIPAILFEIEKDRFLGPGNYSPTFYQWFSHEIPIGDPPPDWKTLIHPDDVPVFQNTLEHCKKNLIPFYEARYRLKASGNLWRPVIERGKIHYSQKGETLSFSGIIIEQRPEQNENELLKNLLTALEDTRSRKKDLFLVIDSTQEVLFVSRTVGTFISPKESHPTTLEAIFPSPLPEQVRQKIQTLRQRQQASATIGFTLSGNHFSLEIRRLPVQSSLDWFLFFVPQRLREQQKVPENFLQRLNLLFEKRLEISQDFRVDEVLRQAMQLARILIPAAQAGSLLVKEGGGFRYREGFGYEMDRLRNIVLFEPTTEHTEVQALQLREMHNGSRVIHVEQIRREAQRILPRKQYELLRQYGRLDEIYHTLSALIQIDHKPFAILNLDAFQKENPFTEFDQKLMDLLSQQISDTLKIIQLVQRVKESETNYRQLFERSPIAIYILQDNRFKLFNPNFLRLTGLSEKEAREIEVWDLVHPDDRPALQKRAMARLRGEKPLSEYEFRLINKNGEVLNCLGSFTRVTFNGKPAILGEIMNITRLRMLERQLLQVQKMETVGTLTAGIAHDFNNILGAILPSAQLIQDDPQNPANASRARIIVEMAQRASQLTHQLLSFARAGEFHKQVINFNELIRNSQQILEKLLPRRIQLKLELDDTTPPVEGDANQIIQVIINMVINARDAIEAAGQIVIQTYPRSARVTRLLTVGTLPPGKYAVVSIKDNGCGIPDNLRDKIFDPFFTTKPVGKGTGLGLSTVYGIVKRHKGCINLRTRVGKGTTFEIFIPATTKREDRRLTKRTPRTRGIEPGLTTLIIDDEDHLREILGLMLTELGFRVLSAETGKKGIKIFRERKDAIDLIILDHVMPELNGKQTLEVLRQIKPDVKVLLATGYGDHKSLTDLYRMGIDGFLTKPFTFDQLKEKIREVMSGTLKT